MRASEPVEVRCWVDTTREAQGLPPDPTEEELARIVAAISNTGAKGGVNR